MARAMATWQVQDAKAHLADLIQRARTEGLCFGVQN